MKFFSGGQRKTHNTCKKYKDMSVSQTWSRQAAKKHVSLKHNWGHDCGEVQSLNVQISKIKVI